MTPRARVAGLAGMASGVGLAVEFGLFMASGWTASDFASPDAALALLASGGTELRAAGVVGLANLALWLLLLGGLVESIRHAAPTCAAAALYFGMTGAIVHAIVPMGLWTDVPIFLGLSSVDVTMARAAWPAFSVAQAAATGVGYLFGGFALIALAAGLRESRQSSGALAWTAALAGAMGVLIVLGTATPLAALAEPLFAPSLLLGIAFRTGAGRALWRGRLQTRAE